MTNTPSTPKKEVAPLPFDDPYGGVGFDTAKLFGLRETKALVDYQRHPEGSGKYGVVKDDFRCDADAPSKLRQIVEAYEQKQ